MADYPVQHPQCFADSDKPMLWYQHPPPTVPVPSCFSVPPPPFIHPPPASLPPPPPASGPLPSPTCVPPPAHLIPPPHILASHLHTPPPICEYSSSLSSTNHMFGLQNSGNSSAHAPQIHNDIPQHTSYIQVQNSNKCFIPQSGTSVQIVDQDMEDEKWMRQFLSQRKGTDQLRASPKKLKIFEAKDIIINCLNILEELKVAHTKVLSSCDVLNSSEWQLEMDDINKKKTDVAENLKQLHNPGILKMLQISLAKRRKKRKSQKQQRENWRLIKTEQHAERQKLHKDIDTWLENMQESVEKAKMEESLKLEADAVLSDVTKRKAEARRQLALLSALARLRTLRAKTATARGERVSSELEACFARVIDNLESLWEEKMEEYKLEEKGLRVMLTEAVDERKIRYDRTVLANWKSLLFGQQATNVHPFYTVAERTIDDFIAIRRSWDKCLAPASAPMSSTIPIGWVLPSNPASGAWESLLSSEAPED